MGQWLSELWSDKAAFRALVRALAVLLGQAALVLAPELAAATGLREGLVQGVGVLLTGGAAGIPAGQQNVRFR
jgi:hypothetical protein